MRPQFVKTVLGAALIGGLGMGPAFAATFPVTKTADTSDGVCNADCSLREAIIAANASPGVDTVTVPAGTYLLSRTGANEDLATTGDLDLRGDIIINGAGATLTIIDGVSQDRIFDVIDGITTEIRNLTLKNGLTIDDSGAGMYNRGITTLKNVRFEGNVSNIYGGAIENRGTGRLTIDTGYFKGNCSFSGGALDSTIGLTIVNSIFDANVPVLKGGINCPNSDGAAIHVQDGIATIDNSTFINNIGEVGAISGYGGSLTVTNSTIANNRGLGGGNSPTGPGGIAPQTPTIAISVVNSTIASNTAFQAGGGVFGPVALVNSIVANNIAPSGADCSGSVVSNGYNIFGSIAGCSVGLQASDRVVNPSLGALTVDTGTGQSYLPLLAASPAIDTANPAACPATDQIGKSRPIDGDGNGSAICDIGAFEYAVPVTANVCPTGCQYKTIQAAINAATAGSTVTVGSGTYRERLTISKTLTVKSLNGASGTVIDASGLNKSVVTITGLTTLDGFTITGGKAANGGGIAVTNGGATIRNNIIRNNVATTAGGGLYFAAPYKSLLVENNRFESNTATTRGGALMLGQYSPQTVTRNTFVTNSSTNGGAIASSAHGGEAIVNNLFINNHNTIWLPSYATSGLANNTIVGSTGYAAQKGANGQMALTNSILWNNASNLSGAGWLTSYSLINVDPRFVNAAGGNYRVLAGSPAIDTGGNTANLGVLTDHAGIARPRDGDGLGAGSTGDGSDYDIGAYEY